MKYFIWLALGVCLSATAEHNLTLSNHDVVTLSPRYKVWLEHIIATHGQEAEQALRTERFTHREAAFNIKIFEQLSDLEKKMDDTLVVPQPGLQFRMGSGGAGISALVAFDVLENLVYKVYGFNFRYGNLIAAMLHRNVDQKSKAGWLYRFHQYNPLLYPAIHFHTPWHRPLDQDVKANPGRWNRFVASSPWFGDLPRGSVVQRILLERTNHYPNVALRAWLAWRWKCESYLLAKQDPP